MHVLATILAVATVVQAHSGSTVHYISTQQVNHPGPTQYYLAKVPDGKDVKSWDGSGAVWFKISTTMPSVNAQKQMSWPGQNEYTTPNTTIPATTPASEYLLRVEHIALHMAMQANKAQFYLARSQIKITEGGSGVPGPLVALPGAYKSNDPGILVDLNKYTAAPETYQPPGSFQCIFLAANVVLSHQIIHRDYGSLAQTEKDRVKAESASPWAIENPPAAPSIPFSSFLVLTMTTTVVLGAQWGDEGKGKLADILAHESQICCRAQGGNNAGHTIVANGVTYDFHILPSGLVNPGCINVIGSGCVVHVPSFFKELEALEKHGLNTEGRIFISDRAHVVFDVHQKVDGLEEVELGGGMIGTTKKGIGPTYSTKMTRSGLRMCDLFDEQIFETKLRRLASGFQKRYGDLLKYDVDAEIAQYKTLREKLAPYVVDQIPLLASAKEKNAKILVEGANALMLDIDYGTYPFVTSSNTGIGGVITGLNLGWRSLKEVIGVVKAYTTRVGSGPFPTEQLNELGEKLQSVGHEVGVTTGRKRRCGWLDLVVVKHSHACNDYTAINLTKLDVLDDFDELKVATSYSYNGEVLEGFPANIEILGQVEVQYDTLPGWKKPTTGVTSYYDLPVQARNYIEYIEKFVGVKVKWIGVGPARDHMISRS
ncbi:glycoside hydrolase [Alternaria alternata]|nr:glycoside hydrolase [Alternaria alternata]